MFSCECRDGFRTGDEKVSAGFAGERSYAVKAIEQVQVKCAARKSRRIAR
jgi:hypothetical protein